MASVGAKPNSKRVALIHFTFNAIGTVAFSAIIWIFKDSAVELLVNMFPGEDPMSLQMRVSAFHVIFNVSTTLLLLPFTRQLVNFSRKVISDEKEEKETLRLRFVDDRLLSTPKVAMAQVKKEIDYMMALVEENSRLSFVAIDSGTMEHDEKIRKNEEIIDFTNAALTRYLIRLSANVEESDEKIIGAYFHVLNDLERIGDHAENFHEIGVEMIGKGLSFSPRAAGDIHTMREITEKMLEIAKNAFENRDAARLEELSALEQQTDDMKKDLIASHFSRLAEGNCSVDVSPYYSSVIVGLERVGDHLVNVGYSILNPTGDQDEIQ